jgi:hypothetical protein
VRAFDVDVVVTPGSGTAEASGLAGTTRTTGGAPERDRREVRATFTAAGGEWLLSPAAVVDAVEPPR